MFRNVKKPLIVVLGVSVLAVGGAAIAGAATLNGPSHGTAAHEGAEKAVTGGAATQAQDAAVKSVGGGTAGAVTTDGPGTGYEVTVTKTDGSTVDVHLNSSFTAFQGHRGHGGWGHGSAAHEGAEKAVTGGAATQAQDAAVKSVGSGTAGAVTTDGPGTGYEVTVTKTDGSTVEVHLNSSFAVLQGHGGHGDWSHGGYGA